MKGKARVTIPADKKRLVVLSHSENEEWLTCRHRWGLKYHLGLRTKVVPGAWVRGRWAHAGLEAAYERLAYLQGMGATVELDELAKHARERIAKELAAYQQNERSRVPAEAWGEFVAECDSEREKHGWMVEHALGYILRDFGARRLVATEWRFDYPLPGGVQARARGIVDAVVANPDQDSLEIHEHKSFATSTDDVLRRLDRDPQTLLYLWAVQEGQRRGDLPGGTTGTVFFNVMRRSYPHQPAHTKAGLVSAAKIDTTAAVYQAALDAQVARGEPVTEAQERLLRDLEGRPDTYFRQHEAWFGQAQVEAYVADLVVTAGDIRRAHLHPDRLTRNLSHCTNPRSGRCQYEMICADPGSTEARAQLTSPEEREAARAAPIVEERKGDNDGPDEALGF